MSTFSNRDSCYECLDIELLEEKDLSSVNSDYWKGYSYGLLAAFFMAIEYTVAKYMMVKISNSFQIVFVRSLMLLVYDSFRLYYTLESQKIFSSIIKHGFFNWILLRGVCGGTGKNLMFHFNSYAPLGEIFTVFSINTINSTVLSHFMLKEYINRYNVMSILVCFTGVVLIKRPGFIFGTTESDNLFPLRNIGLIAAFAVSWTDSIAAVAIRKVKEVPAEVTTLSMAFFALLFSAIGLFFTDAQELTKGEILSLLLIGVLGMINTLFQASGARYMEVRKYQMLRQSVVVWVFILDWLMFGISPESLTIVGVCLIICANIGNGYAKN